MSNNSETYKNYFKNLKTQGDGDFLEQIDFSKIVLVLRKSVIWVILFFALGISSSKLYLRYTAPTYQSYSTVKIKLENEAQEVNLIRGRSNGGDEADLSGEVELIKSKIVYDQVIENLNLWVSYYAQGRILDEEKYPHDVFQVLEYEIINSDLYNQKIYVQLIDEKKIKLSYSLGDMTVEKHFDNGQIVTTNDATFKIMFNKLENQEGRSLYFIVHNNPKLYSYLGELQVFPNEQSKTISISFVDKNRLKAQSIVSHVDSIYLKLTLEEKKKKNEQSIKYIESQLEKTGMQLSKYETFWEDFSRKHKSINIEQDQNYYFQKLKNNDQELVYANERLEVLKTMMANLIKDSVRVNLKYLSYIKNEKLFALSDQLFETFNDIQRTIRLTGKTSTLIDMKIKNYEIVKEKAIQLIKDEMESEGRWINDLHEIQNSINKKLEELPQKATTEYQIGRQFSLYEKFYQMLQEKKLEYEIANAGIVQEFKILSPASLPYEPIAPNRNMIYVYGIVVALTFSLLLIIIRYLLHNTLITQNDFANLTRVPILGVVPKFKKKMDVSQLVVNQNPKSSISEAFRSLRTNLEFLSSTEGKKIFSVTSTISGEGKTFVSSNLSAIIALSGKKVVLLDLDMRKPKVHLAFDMENNEGMSTILIGKTNYKDCIQHTEIQGFDFISAGPIPPNPSELILRDSFDKILADLHKEYDIIMIDTPPTGLVTDGVLIMKKVDAPLYVTRSEYTKKGFEKNLNALYAQKEFSKLAIIINGMSSLGTNYGYGYGSGNYYEEEEDEKSIFQRLFSKS